MSRHLRQLAPRRQVPVHRFGFVRHDQPLPPRIAAVSSVTCSTQVSTCSCRVRKLKMHILARNRSSMVQPVIIIFPRARTRSRSSRVARFSLSIDQRG